MAQDRIAFLADGHLTSDDPERLDTLCRALEDLSATCAEVCILGDSFEVWLGVATAQPHVERVRRSLALLRERGVRTVYVEGNRDFAIGRGATAAMFDLVATGETVERFGSCSFHLSHGDRVNTADWQYRAWRGFSRHLLAPALLTVLPSAASLALGRSLERRFRSTNRRHKSRFPEERCVAFARAKIAAGADVVVVGHFHQEVEREIEIGGRRGRFLSLPFWHAEPRAVLFDRAGTRVA